ncbi:umecyanin-like [Morus notabilis]|uniref:umecyanin-like n=1 Tax=Morus notabilis TaxID=981085 RepID=UPI000CECF0D8|nr:umecyanin-like [Morus notabilis]
MGFMRSLFFVFLVVIFAERSDATVYNVGDVTGWGIPANNDFYDDWTNNKTFRVGDQLSFNWTAGTHDVAEVNENDYDNCTKVSIVIASPVVINLTKPGEHYFICTIGDHCQRGQKLDIEVQAANSTAPPPSGTTTGTTPSSIGALCATISFLVFSFLA